MLVYLVYTLKQVDLSDTIQAYRCNFISVLYHTNDSIWRLPCTPKHHILGLHKSNYL